MTLPLFKKEEKSGVPQEYIQDLAVLMKKFSNDNSMKYLEVGAFDGVQYSNTLCLKTKLGWSGLLVEPIKEYFQLLKLNRPQDICVNALLTSGGSEGLLRIKKAGPMSQVSDDKYTNGISLKDWVIVQLRKILFWHPSFAVARYGVEAVRTTTVNQLCADHQIKRLHFISCDVEGMEYEVLKGIDFSGLDVLAILVEVRPHNIMPILELLLPSRFVCTEAMSRFNKQDNPQWDGTHQDYLFLRRDFIAWMENVSNAAEVN